MCGRLDDNHILVLEVRGQVHALAVDELRSPARSWRRGVPGEGRWKGGKGEREGRERRGRGEGVNGGIWGI